MDFTFLAIQYRPARGFGEVNILCKNILYFHILFIYLFIKMYILPFHSLHMLKAADRVKQNLYNLKHHEMTLKLACLNILKIKKVWMHSSLSLFKHLQNDCKERARCTPFEIYNFRGVSKILFQYFSVSLSPPPPPFPMCIYILINYHPKGGKKPFFIQLSISLDQDDFGLHSNMAINYSS